MFLFYPINKTMRKRITQLFALMANNNNRWLGRIQVVSSFNNMFQQGFASKIMQHFRNARMHAFTNACGKNNCTNRSEEHTSELQSQFHLVCRLLLEKKQTK